MTTLPQLRRVSELLQNGWQSANEPANLDPETLPMDGPIELTGPDCESYLVHGDGHVEKGRIDWDQYCVGGKADWPAPPPFI